MKSPCLSLLRPEEVHDAFDILRQNSPAIANRMFDYFKSTYIARYRHAEMIDPPFNIPSWNAHQAVTTDGQRTNNGIEGWHRQFRRRFLNDHPALSKFIEQIKEEEQLMDNRVRPYEADHTVGISESRRKKTYVQNDMKIRQLVTEYDNRNAAERDVLHHLSALQNRL